PQSAPISIVGCAEIVTDKTPIAAAVNEKASTFSTNDNRCVLGDAPARMAKEPSTTNIAAKPPTVPKMINAMTIVRGREANKNAPIDRLAISPRKVQKANMLARLIATVQPIIALI